MIYLLEFFVIILLLAGLIWLAMNEMEKKERERGKGR